MFKFILQLTIGYANRSVKNGLYGGKYYYSFEMEDCGLVAGQDLTLDTAQVTYDTLKSGTSGVSGFPDGCSVIFRAYVLQGGSVQAVYLTNDNGASVDGSKLISVDVLGYLGQTFSGPSSGSITVTGSNSGAGILGGENAGSLSGGTPSLIVSGTRTSGTTDPDPDPSPDPDPDPDPDPSPNPDPDPDPDPSPAPDPDSGDDTEDVRSSGSGILIDVTDAEDADESSYRVVAIRNGVELSSLNGATVTVTFPMHFSYVPAGNLYVVFTAEDGSLCVIPAEYMAVSGVVTFDTTMLGEFRLVWLAWDGTDMTAPDFLDAIAAAMLA